MASLSGKVSDCCLAVVYFCVCVGGGLVVVGGAFVWMFKLESEVDESESQQL